MTLRGALRRLRRWNQKRRMTFEERVALEAENIHIEYDIRTRLFQRAHPTNDTPTNGGKEKTA